MSNDVRRAAENILATVVFIRDSNGEVVIQSRCWLWAREVAQAYLTQQREDTTEGGYVGWTIVAEGEDGSLLLQSKTGARRRIWPPHKADDDEPVTEETTMPEHHKETPIPNIRAEAEQCLQRQREARTPWFVHGCGVPDCWCRVVTIGPDPESRDMEKCVVTSGALRANDAETLVAVMNSPLPILALELCDRVERADQRIIGLTNERDGWLSRHNQAVLKIEELEAEVERLRKQIDTTYPPPP